jgi:regulator of replication initiation timing
LTILTPNFADLLHAKTNGAAGPPVVAHPGSLGGEGPPSQQTNETCSAAGERGSADVGEGSEAAQPAAPPPLKIAMVGTAPSSRMLAPFNDPSWTIWGCSPGNMNALPRVNAWFELHSNLLWPEYENYGRPYIEWLKVQKFPVYMQDQSLVPNAAVFPMYDIVKEFGMSFFTSSFAWMMALAMKMGAAEIALYGIDMASRDEYILQRPGFYFFRHMAQVRGIKVSAPHESDIMQDPPLYAYVDSTAFGRKIRARAQEVNGRIAQMQPQHNQLGNNITYLQGAKEDIDYFESIWSGVSNEMSILKYENTTLKLENERLKAAQAAPVIAFEPVAEAIVQQIEHKKIAKPRRRRAKAEAVAVPPNGGP